MATQIAEAYVQIKPSLKGIKNELSSQMNSEGAGAGESFGASMVSKLKGIIAAAGIGAIVKEALDAGGALQQSFGGLETLYGDASQAAKDYAKAAATAGISMNDYAEQAVSFGASLKQAFEGADNAEALAAEAANTAIMDMADNAAKMGSDIGSIQSAYQGFAKQNYTMLDNLKLGYGGTKSEMERLLKTANEINKENGKITNYSIDNLGDVYEAIHVIQEDLGLTGVAADEAATTFTGSFGAMKAAATNLLADLTTGADITDDLGTLMDSAFNFATNNLAPMVMNLLQGLPTILNYGLSAVIRGLNIAGNNAEEMVNTGVELVSELVNGILANLPYIIESGIRLIVAFGKALVEYDWIGLASDFMDEFVYNMDIAAGEILGADSNLLGAFIEWIANILPRIVEQGAEIILSLVNGIISNLPSIVAGMSEVIASLLATLAENMPEIITKGFEILTNLIVGLISAIPDLIKALPEIFTAIKDAFDDYDWKTLGKNILEGIGNGITGAVTAVVEAAKEAAKEIYEAVKGFFKIESPSKLMRDDIGKWIPAGIAVGIEGNMDSLNKAISDMNEETFGATLSARDYSYNPGNIATRNSSSDMSAIAKAIRSNQTNVTVVLEGDAKKLFKAMQSESKNYNTLTGRSAFA